MADYRVISLDLRTGQRVAELEMAELRYGHRLNDIGTVEGVVKLPSPRTPGGRARAAVLNDAVEQYRRHLIVERDGVVVGDGIVVLNPYDDATQTRAIKASSTWWYFRNRHITRRLFYGQVDQLDMARNLIAVAQETPPGNIGVTYDTTTSGRLRDRTFEGYELKEVGEAVEQLAAVEDGFDFAIDCSWDPVTGGLVKRLNLGYPRRGRRYTETGHVFEVGRNVVSFEWPASGVATANQVIATGVGEGESMLRATATDAYQLTALADGGPGYPLLQAVLSDKDISRLSTLQGKATARLHARRKPVVLPTVKVRADRDPVLGSYITGDSCRFIIPPNVSPLHPDGLDTYYRIVGYDVTVSNEGGEEVDLILGEEPAT